MNKGLRVVICIIAIMLVMIAERGAPVKFVKWDYPKFIVLLFMFLYMTNSL